MSEHVEAWLYLASSGKEYLRMHRDGRVDSLGVDITGDDAALVSAIRSWIEAMKDQEALG